MNDKMSASSFNYRNFFKLFAGVCTVTLIILAVTLNSDTTSIHVRQSLKFRLRYASASSRAAKIASGKNGASAALKYIFPQYLYGKWQFQPGLAADVSNELLRYTCCSKSEVGYNPRTHKPTRMLNCTRASYGGALSGGKVAFGWGNWCACAAYHNEERSDVEGRLPSVGRWRWMLEGTMKLLPEFDADTFCKALGKRKLVLIGDSTMQQTWTVLVNSVASQRGVCLGQTEYFASDFLAPRDEVALGHGAHNERGKSMVEHLQPYVNRTSDIVVVFGVAAHFNHLKNYKTVLRWIGNYTDQHRQLIRAGPSTKKPSFTFYFKTANPPHANCKDYSDPWLSWQVDFKANDQVRYKYWRQALLYDELAVEILQNKVKGFIDMTPLYLRPDAHADDCLHYCMNSRSGSALDLFPKKLQLALTWPTATLV